MNIISINQVRNFCWRFIAWKDYFFGITEFFGYNFLEVKIETNDALEYKKGLKDAVSLVLADNLPLGGVDVLCYHGRSFGDEDPILSAVADITKGGKANYVIIPGDNGERVGEKGKQLANIGREEIVNRLCSLGVKPEVMLVSSKDALHTRAETTAFFSLILNRRFTKIGVIAHPHQLLRIMLGTVNELNRLKIFLPVYSTYPAHTDWEEVVFGSQGRESKPRREHILDEMIRIPVYQQKGDLATFEELAEYYRARGDKNKIFPESTDLKIISDYINRMNF